MKTKKLVYALLGLAVGDALEVKRTGEMIENPPVDTIGSGTHHQPSSIEMPHKLGKNTWLNPTDEFGKMEIGTVYESKNYDHGRDASSKPSDFDII